MVAGSITFNNVVPNWGRAPLSFSRENSDILIFHGNTAAFQGCLTQFQTLLNFDENQHASKFYQQKNRDDYAIQHGVLRLILGEFIKAPPASLIFRFNNNHKPYLAGPHDHCFFNLSHSDDDFLIGVSDIEIGVDVEQINRSRVFKDVAAQFFNIREIDQINAAADPAMQFFKFWTRKEALLKASGKGLNDDLPAIVALEGENSLPLDHDAIHRTGHSFNVHADLAGCVVYPGPPRNLRFYRVDTRFVENLLSAVY